ncbi:MAG: phosphoglycerate kinase [Methanomassiliicoccaceae archaeon]|nr:phosphoglycerate kinase [Methanomassiliicoccaceae archaeon]
MKDFNTLEDFNFKDRTVLLRVDINCPLDKKTLTILNDARIRSIVPTVRELIGKRAKVVILAHQSRKGAWDFIGLEQHAALLSKNLNAPVKYVNDVIGDAAKKAISEMRSGEVIMLGNVRELDCEAVSAGMSEHAGADLVAELSPFVDYYVCDAFGTSHRSQCSLVGFPIKVPSASGRLMAREIYALNTILGKPKQPSVFILGGAKFGDIPHMIDRVLSCGIADTVIVVGLAGNAFLLARGVDIGEASCKILADELTEKNFQAARDILGKHGQKVLLPVDVAVERNGRRVCVKTGDMPTAEPALDIGDKSIDKFRKVILSSKTSFMSGPAGMFEKPGFEVGTKQLIMAMVESKGLSVLGGGHTAGAAESFDLADRISYVSTGGGALETLLLREPLPVIEALKYSKEKFGPE